jgi:hypothetical protein
MVIAVLAMVYSAAVEAWRLDIFRNMPDSGGDSGSDDPAWAAGAAAGAEPGAGYGPAVVPLSIMWQAPAYVLIGASEVLASIAQLEFFYDQAPDVMRSCSMALQLLSTAVGSYLGGGLVAAVAALSVAAGQPWLPKDLNLGHLDWFLLLCGALMAANSLLFVLVANNYEYKVSEDRLVGWWALRWGVGWCGQGCYLLGSRVVMGTLMCAGGPDAVVQQQAAMLTCLEPDLAVAFCVHSLHGSMLAMSVVVFSTRQSRAHFKL